MSIRPNPTSPRPAVSVASQRLLDAVGHLHAASLAMADAAGAVSPVSPLAHQLSNGAYALGLIERIVASVMTALPKEAVADGG